MNEATTLTFTNNSDSNSANNSKSAKKSSKLCCFGSKSPSAHSYTPNTYKDTTNLNSYAALVENG